MFNFNIDRKLKKLGFEKTWESDYIIVYERYNEDFEYTHVVALRNKSNIPNIIQSYDKADNHVVGLEIEEMKLFMAKMIRKWGNN